MNAEDRPDEIKIKFSDNNHLWDGWQPNNHDTIKVIDGIAKPEKCLYNQYCRKMDT